MDAGDFVRAFGGEQLKVTLRATSFRTAGPLATRPRARSTRGEAPDVFEALLNRHRSLVASLTWEEKEHINALESRGILFGVKHLLRRRGARGRRLLILSDSMVSVAAYAKGRSSA